MSCQYLSLWRSFRFELSLQTVSNLNLFPVFSIRLVSVNLAQILFYFLLDNNFPSFLHSCSSLHFFFYSAFPPLLVPSLLFPCFILPFFLFSYLLSLLCSLLLCFSSSLLACVNFSALNLSLFFKDSLTLKFIYSSSNLAK